MTLRRFTFEFTATVDHDVEIPDGVVEGSDAFEKILASVASSICVDDHCEWQDAYPAEDDPP